MVFETFEGVDLLLLGSADPIALDLDRVEERMAELRVRMDLARIDVRRPSDLLPLFVMGPDKVDELVEGAPRNTDDNARVEFSAPKALYRETLEPNLAMLHSYAESPLEYAAPTPADDEERAERRLALARAYLRRDRAAEAEALLRNMAGGPLADEAAELAASFRDPD
jgi:hypothetical protein